MKLIYCPQCHDIVTVELLPNVCRCAQSGCCYADNERDEALFNGDAIPIEIDTESLANAIKRGQHRVAGQRFDGYVVNLKEAAELQRWKKVAITNGCWT